MNIGIDIDDTIIETAEFVTPRLSEFLSPNKDASKNNPFPSDPRLAADKDREMIFNKEAFEKIMSEIPPKPDAKKIIGKLKAEGHKIIIITARDESVYKGAFEFSSCQLKKLGIEYDKLFCSFDKRKICAEEKIDLFIDDSVENLQMVKGAVKKVLLFNSKANKKQECGFTRVSSWKEIYDFINSVKI